MRTSTSRKIVSAAILSRWRRALSGCGAVAFAVRVTSATAKVVPVAGNFVAYPLDETADAID